MCACRRRYPPVASRLSFVDEAGREVVARARIAQRYARAWLLTDLLTLVPVEMIAMLALSDDHPLSHGGGHRLMMGLQCAAPSLPARAARAAALAAHELAATALLVDCLFVVDRFARQPCVGVCPTPQ